ncbi:prophage tail fiber N-terminal domain-containing protein [Serratia liquefaciens]|uniref:prophage tail fiber N-terminal domain-containing protein n=1 Tax=Serratia liquefaciens TaxID=614 RepID=UPI0021578A92|nr:prophage tail fiber N-terminal domain-containing protein [Serratia liquefaciens]
MALISDVLRGPYGDPQPDVIITMRAKGTSSKVLVSNSSATTTDADGKYSMQVFPGRYEVLVSTLGNIGEIQVFSDSKDGTLNDFLLAPGEDELTPAVVQTVDTMRADAAKSAAAAKVSEQNSADNVKPVVAAGFGSGPLHAADAFSKDNKSSIQRFTNATANRPANTSGGLLTLPIDGGPSCSYLATSVTRQAWVGNSNTAAPSTVVWSRLFSTSDLPTVNDISNLKDWGLSKGVTAASKGNFNAQMQSRRGYVSTDPIGNPFKDTGTHFLDTRSWAVTQTGTDDSYRTVQTCYGYGASATSVGKIAVRSWNGTIFTPWIWLWSEANTTVDSNGFIKKASPIVKLFRDGSCELNDESQGVTTERVSDGVYRVSGTLGFNADAEWGGPDGGIEVPLDRNKQPLIWVDYEVEATGDLLIKTFHRTHPTAPAFARNEVMGYDEGMPIDIPKGRWVDLRVEMPAAEESDPDIEVEEAEPEN